MATALLERAKIEGWTDEEVVERVKGGETALYEILMRRYNQRLYRAARAILKDEIEAEDVMQDAYVRAFQNLHQFEGRAPFSAWLLRIAVNEALGRKRGRDRNVSFEEGNENGEISMSIVETGPDPEQSATRAELGQMLEEAVLSLPEAYRTVVMLRDVEELNTSETAEALDLSKEIEWWPVFSQGWRGSKDAGPKPSATNCKTKGSQPKLRALEKATLRARWGAIKRPLVGALGEKRNEHHQIRQRKEPAVSLASGFSGAGDKTEVPRAG